MVSLGVCMCDPAPSSPPTSWVSWPSISPPRSKRGSNPRLGPDCPCLERRRASVSIPYGSGPPFPPGSRHGSSDLSLPFDPGMPPFLALVHSCATHRRDEVGRTRSRRHGACFEAQDGEGGRTRTVRGRACLRTAGRGRRTCEGKRSRSRGFRTKTDRVLTRVVRLATAQLDAFQRQAVELVQPSHGTTTLGFIFQGGVIVAVDSRASQGSYVCTCTCDRTRAPRFGRPPPRATC
eukprot:scaffold867_cov317-Pavlova_lutheri.AAC.63